MPNEIENFNENQLTLITSGTETSHVFDSEGGDYIRMTIFTTDGVYVDQFFSNKNEIIIYSSPAEEIYVKPNEILEDNLVPHGNYKLQFDFLRNVFSNFSGADDSNFVIKEISPSRKEVRLFGRDGSDNQIDLGVTSFQDAYMSGSDVGGGGLGTLDDSDGYGDYTFDWILGVSKGRNLSINNYTFDNISDTSNVTLILRLNDQIPNDVSTLNLCSIEREVITTQTQEIFYVSNVKSQVFGTGLNPDVDSFYSLVNDSTTDSYQNYEQLIGTASISENLSDLISSNQDDINLKVDFSDFSNHAFFGSAVSKLENFKYKIGKIQNHLVELSSSLSNSGSHVNNRRKELFSKVKDLKDTFTPYETWMYFDNQGETTSSAPGIGQNLAHSNPTTNDELTILNNYDGFNVVYKHTNEEANDQYTDLFTNKYFAEDPPFYNYTGSVYLSFVLKGDESISYSDGTLGLRWDNKNSDGSVGETVLIPSKALHQNRSLSPVITGSEYRRFIFEASQSHWRPTGSAINSVGEGDIGEFPLHWITFGDSGNNVYYEILNTQDKVTSASMITNSYPIVLNGDYINLGTTLTGSEVPFTGSIMPAGEYFRLWYDSGSAITSSFMTDIKITTNNPMDSLPFGQLYNTGSTIWSNWYDGLHSLASQYDEDNIHSLKNNLPKSIKESNDYDTLRTFVNMWGEKFDTFRNYIDTYKTFYKRGYSELDSVPSNLLPILADNVGWELINPFSSSLADYFGGITGSATSVQDITHNTWRKQLNNLIYIYKSKGTENSVRALLNTYGYPGDVLSIDELGGSLEASNPEIITDTIDTFKFGMGGSKGNISYIREPQEFYTFNFSGSRKLNLDWWTNGANPDGLEFVFKSPKTLNDQVIFESSGSSTGSMWDIRLITSASTPIQSKLEFRLNNSTNGRLPIASNAVTMSTDYLPIKGNGKLWNAYLTRMTSSLSSSISQSYRLYVGFQGGEENDKITHFSVASMSITESIANVNFMSGSTLSSAVSGNLVVGETFSGSLGEIRAWSGSLSASKFKQHVLNKFSVVGNNLISLNDLNWHYRLRENHLSGSTGKKINDANPNYNGDYSKLLTLTNNGDLYSKQTIDVVKLTTRTDGISSKNSNMITIGQNRTLVRDLDSNEESYRTPYEELENKRKATTKLEIIKTPSKIIDDYIINITADKDVSEKFSKWSDTYESNYKELDDLRNELYKGLHIDINAYIDAQAKVFNQSVIESIERILPAKARLSTGVVIKQSLLERSKIVYHRSSIDPQRTPYFMDLGDLEKLYFDFSGSQYDTGYGIDNNLNLIDYLNFVSSKYTTAYKNTGLSYTTFLSESMNYNPTYKSTLDLVTNYMSQSMNYNPTMDSTLDLVTNYMSQSMTYNPAYNSTLDLVPNYMSQSMTYNPAYNSTLDLVDDYISQSMNYNPTYKSTLNLTNDYISQSMNYNPTYKSTLDLVNTHISESGDYITGHIANITESSDRFIAGYSSPADTWGTSSNDTHFISWGGHGRNEPSAGGVYGDFNTYYYEDTQLFYTIGDMEMMSSSINHVTCSDGTNNCVNVDIDPTNYKVFHNRLITDTGKGYTYKSYFGVGASTDGALKDGRPMGRTAFFFTASNGDLIYPSNHYINVGTSKDMLGKAIYEGTKNNVLSQRFTYGHTFDTIPTASAYTIQVDGADTERILKVSRPGNRPTSGRR